MPRVRGDDELMEILGTMGGAHVGEEKPGIEKKDPDQRYSFLTLQILLHLTVPPFHRCILPYVVLPAAVPSVCVCVGLPRIHHVCYTSNAAQEMSAIRAHRLQKCTARRYRGCIVINKYDFLLVGC